MTDEQWLREGLADAVPEPPINPDRAQSAERLARRRRRTTTMGVLGAAGAVAAAAVLTVTLTSGGDDPDEGLDTTTTEGPAFVVECPPITVEKDGIAQGSEIDQPDPAAPSAVPEGATSARLCQGPGTTLEVPANALVTGVDELVTAVNDLEAPPEHQMCTDELGPGYRIAFGYDDESSFVVSGQLYGCQTVVVGSAYRAPAETAQSAFLDLLDEQQVAGNESSDEADAADLSCTDPSLVGGSAVVSLTAAILCIEDGRGDVPSAVIDSADLAFLVDDMATHQSNSVLRCALPPPYPTIVGTDTVGNDAVIQSECGTIFWRLPNGKAWMPSEDAVAILDQLVGEAR